MERNMSKKLGGGYAEWARETVESIARRSGPVRLVAMWVTKGRTLPLRVRYWKHGGRICRVCQRDCSESRPPL